MTINMFKPNIQVITYEDICFALDTFKIYLKFCCF